METQGVLPAGGALMGFFERLNQAIERNRSLVCVGLDPDPNRMPEGIGVSEFNRAIIDATADLVCAYKPNLAFYEALGDKGLQALRQTLRHLPSGVPVIADAKRGDIGNVSAAYATALFDDLGFDAATVNPYLGFDSVQPFLAYRDRGVYVLCRTSNPGSGDFQELRCRFGDEERPLYEIVALRASQWNTSGNVGLVVGATYAEELGAIRRAHPDVPLLVPGVGAQGGDLAGAVRHGADARGAGMIINSSRGILYASRGSDFAEAARQAAADLRDQINRHLAERAP
jgi:orotidine-5'-phosphate decarboxylase